MPEKKIVRGFYHLSEAWYGPANISRSDFSDEVIFGSYHTDGGCKGEMTMRWDNIGAHRAGTAPRRGAACG